MRTTQIKKKYPEMWEKVYHETLEDLRVLDGLFKEEIMFVAEKKETIAYNAAATACFALHKIYKVED